MVGGSVGARQGILIKDGEVFEKAKNIDYVLFDKTGTLTKGEPELESTIINKEIDIDERTIIKLAASLAENSQHPLSETIVNYAKQDKVVTKKVNKFQEISGQGIRAEDTENNKEMLLGNLRLLKENYLNLEWAEKQIELRDEKAGTILFIAYGKEVLAAFIIVDKIRETSKKTIDTLRAMNIESVMISGDNKSNVKIIADRLGIKKYYAEILPHEKQMKVKKFQADGAKVVFVGDGINDAPSLVQADLGIAVASGSDIAKESGGVILTQSDPYKVVKAIELSRLTFKIIKQNLFWAFFYNVLAIPLAVAGFVNPMFGALAMGMSDIFVIGNSLRIYNNK